MANGASNSQKTVGSSTEPCPLQKSSILVQALRRDTREPIGGCTIQLTGPSGGDKTTTAGSGSAEYNPADPGDYQVSLSLPASQRKRFGLPRAQRFSLSSAEHKLITLEVVPPGRLEVRVVRTDTWAAVEGASILPAGPERLDAKKSPANGWAIYQEVTPGEYAIKVSLDGKLADQFGNPLPRNETVPAGSVKQVTIGVELIFNCWIELELLDDQGNGIGHEPYWIRLPNQQVREGRLGPKGRARLDKIPCGDCLVRFPKLDATECQELPPGDAHDWLELELLDDDGQPVPDEPYRVKCADGALREGTLGKNGRARIENIKAGTCSVVFPGIHAREFIAP